MFSGIRNAGGYYSCYSNRPRRSMPRRIPSSRCAGPGYGRSGRVVAPPSVRTATLQSRGSPPRLLTRRTQLRDDDRHSWRTPASPLNFTFNSCPLARSLQLTHLHPPPSVFVSLAHTGARTTPPSRPHGTSPPNIPVSVGPAVCARLPSSSLSFAGDVYNTSIYSLSTEVKPVGVISYDLELENFLLHLKLQFQIYKNVNVSSVLSISSEREMASEELRTVRHRRWEKEEVARRSFHISTRNRTSTNLTQVSRMASGDGPGVGSQTSGLRIASGNLPPIEKLAGMENYNNWKFSMKMYLIHEQLWECVQGTENNAAKDQIALAKICLSVLPTTFVHVRNAKTSTEAWENLRKAYEDRGLLRRLTLLRKLFSIKLEQYGSMETYVSEIMSLSQKLQDIDSALEDEFIGVLMLNGLTSNYDPMIMALENSGIQITSELVKAKLLQEDSKIVGESQPDSALVTGKFKKHKKKIFCYSCKKEGHFKSQCPQKKTEKSSAHSVLFATALATAKFNQHDWFVDSGATSHMTMRRDWAQEVQPCEQKEVVVANDEKLTCQGTGDVKITLQGGTSKTLQDVMIVPQLAANLLSVSKIVEKGLTVVFSKDGCKVLDHCSVKGDTVATASKFGGVFRLNLETGFIGRKQKIEDLKSAEAPKAMLSHELWHKRLGHLNRNCMDKLQSLVTGVKFSKPKESRPCVQCLEGKQSRKPFNKKKRGSRAERKLDLVHSDIFGPMSEPTLGGALYLLLFVDDFTRKTFGYLLKTRSEALMKFKEFKASVEKETGNSIKILRTDNGKEYTSKNFEDFLKAEGIKHQKTVPYTPQQNGVAERMGRTVIEKARCLLFDSELPRKYWGEALNTAIYLKNRSPTSALTGKVPEEAWAQKKVDLSHLRIFGSKAYTHVPDQKRTKFDKKTKELVMVGYSDITKGYRLIDRQHPSKLIVARDVVFDENLGVVNKRVDVEILDTNREHFVEFHKHPNFQLPSTSTQQNNLETTEADSQTILRNSSSSESSVQNEGESSQNDSQDQSTDNTQEDPYQDEEDGAEIIQEPRYPVRNRRPPERLQYNAFLAEAGPRTVKEALSSPEKEEWLKAMKKEHDSLIEKGTWTLVDPIPGQKVVENRWVLSKKTDTDGVTPIFKARNPRFPIQTKNFFLLENSKFDLEMLSLLRNNRKQRKFEMGLTADEPDRRSSQNCTHTHPRQT
ncbi:unnamed protein product [Nesidiocoris tenuis]|uniref:Retrovirus-related Pol polyprotein from transposon TNT 1-94 n=2 Tax=Nesidiocoris tenuis TaxID=355587 RepID=A0A6H5FWV4_9HEMI|nr:unnamed protein product [Nesidiocoris tenuis]